MVVVKHTRTFLDLLDLVEGDLKKLLPQIKGALDQIKLDFKVAESDTYIRMYNCINDLDDVIGHLDCLRTDRNAAADITISVPLDLAIPAYTAAWDVQTALENTASVLQGLETSIVSGHISGDDQFVLAAMQITKRSLIDMSDREAATTRRVASLIQQELEARGAAHIQKAA